MGHAILPAGPSVAITYRLSSLDLRYILRHNTPSFQALHKSTIVHTSSQKPIIVLRLSYQQGGE
jgi:hypothetical protein